MLTKIESDIRALRALRDEVSEEEYGQVKPMNSTEIVNWLKNQLKLAFKNPDLIGDINLGDKINALVQYEVNRAVAKVSKKQTNH